MVDSHRDESIWMESLVLIGSVPLVAVFLYLLIDSVYRLALFCRCCGRTDGNDMSDSLLEPTSTFGARTYGAAFPAAEVLPAARSQKKPRSDSDTFSARRAEEATDPSNPFHQSSRLAQSEYTHVPIADGASAALAAENPDANYDSRMLASLLLSVAAITLLAVSIVFSQQYSSSMMDVRNDVDTTQTYVQVTLKDAGVGVLQTDCANTQEALQNLLSAGMASSQPFDASTQSQITLLSAAYGAISSSGLAAFSSQLDVESHHLTRAADKIESSEQVRQDATYSIIGITMAATLAMMAVHTYYRRRLALSLAARTLFALVLLCICMLWCVALAALVGVSDVCQSPVQYSRSMLNSTLVDIAPMDVEVAQYYLDCTTPSEGNSTAQSNPLYRDYFVGVVASLHASDVQGNLSSIVDFISTDRPDLAQFATILTNLNSTTNSDADALYDQLACEQMHATIMHGIEHVCQPIVSTMWTSTILQCQYESTDMLLCTRVWPIAIDGDSLAHLLFFSCIRASSVLCSAPQLSLVYACSSFAASCGCAASARVRSTRRKTSLPPIAARTNRRWSDARQPTSLAVTTETDRSEACTHQTHMQAPLESGSGCRAAAHAGPPPASRDTKRAFRTYTLGCLQFIYETSYASNTVCMHAHGWWCDFTIALCFVASRVR